MDIHVRIFFSLSCFSLSVHSILWQFLSMLYIKQSQQVTLVLSFWNSKHWKSVYLPLNISQSNQVKLGWPQHKFHLHWNMFFILQSEWGFFRHSRSLKNNFLQHGIYYWWSTCTWGIIHVSLSIYCMITSVKGLKMFFLYCKKRNSSAFFILHYPPYQELYNQLKAFKKKFWSFTL